MRAVLGIDAAWTARNPSGVALIVSDGGGWALRSLASSYSEFVDRSTSQASTRRPIGSVPEAEMLLEVATDLAHCPIDVVAIDMPLSREPIIGRRKSDNMVSAAWGARHCGTHTPSIDRPGKISDDLRQRFGQLGYPLATTSVLRPGLYEVYPHRLFVTNG